MNELMKTTSVILVMLSYFLWGVGRWTGKTISRKQNHDCI